MESKAVSKGRIKWIDYVKGFAIIFVVFGHVLLGFEQIEAYPAYQKFIVLVNNWIYSWHMPLFIFISGITYKMSCLKNNSPNYGKIRKNTLNLGLLYIIFGTTLPVLKIIFAKYVNNPVSLKNLAKIILFPETLMWYIWVLIIYYWIFAVLCKGRNFNLLIFAALLCISTAASWVYSLGIIKMLCIKNLLYCSVFFYLGLYYTELQEYLKKTVYFLGVFAICKIIYIVCFYYSSGYELLIDTLLDQLNGFFMIEFIVLIFSKVKKSLSGLEYIGTNSLVIYLLHTYFITILRKVVLKFNIHCLISIIICTIVPLVICVILAYIVNSNKVLGYIFRPIKLVDCIKNKRAECDKRG